MIEVFCNDHYHLELPPNHRFPMEKYRLIQEQLIFEGSFTSEQFVSPEAATFEQINRVHNAEYIEKLEKGLLTKHEIRRSGFPYSKDLVIREKLITGGTINATKSALENGVTFNLAGGTHHAYPDHAEGFCIFNDVAVAASEYLNINPTHKVLIIDLDVHQGNGTAFIFQNEPRVFTFSMHGAKNYPMHKEKSDLDIELPDDITDEQYLRLVKSNVNQLIEFVKPDFVYYLSGVDILVNDTLGKVSISMAACRERDIIVFEALHQKGLPVAVSMGGGYANRIRDIVEAHCNTYRVAKHIFEEI
ncbi:MAG: histone deacetylase [Salinivirgaceae bacterium]|nr:MAG: histone deacetylase [Salinivirgaceae bacterium]